MIAGCKHPAGFTLATRLKHLLGHLRTQQRPRQFQVAVDVAPERVAFGFEAVIVAGEVFAFLAPELLLAGRGRDARRQRLQLDGGIEQPGRVLAIRHQIGETT